MPLAFRQQAIVERAREAGRVTVEDLALRFDVTPQTIRRDLNELCELGMLARVHGGAVVGSGALNLGYEARRAMAPQEKALIGTLCAEQIPHNASLFINIGTTTEAVARALGAHRDLMVITNNLNVATAMTANPSCEIAVAGGVLRRADGGLIGQATADFFCQFKADYAVIGASAIDEDGTLLDYDDREVRVARAIIDNARRVFLVADHTKFARSAPVRIGDIALVDAIFTDLPPSDAFRERCAALDVELVFPGSPLRRPEPGTNDPAPAGGTAGAGVTKAAVGPPS